MAQDAEVIQGLTDTAGSFIHNERLAAAVGSPLIAGSLCEEVGGEVRSSAVASVLAQKLFVLSYLTAAHAIDYAPSVGETVRYGAAHSGQVVFATVAAAAVAIVDGNPLDSAGDGTLKKATDSTTAIAYAMEDLDNSGGAAIVRVKARVA